MPSYPAFALLFGSALWKAERTLSVRRTHTTLNVTQIVLACVGVVIFIGGATALLLTRNIVVKGDISSTLTRNPEAYALSLGHVLDLTPQSLVELRGPILGTALTFGLGTILALVLRRKQKHAASNVALALMMAAFFLCARISLGVFEPYLSSRALAETINRVYQPGDVIIINGEYESGSSINFYTRKTVHILNGRSANLEYGSYFADAPQIFINDQELANIWTGSERIFLFTDSAKVDELTGIVRGPVYPMAENGGKVILTNQEPL